MRTTSTFSILFWVYTQRADKNNLSNIYVRITVNGEKTNTSIKQKVNVDSWDSKRQKARGNGQASRIINLYLDETKSEIVQCYRDLKTETRVVTPQLIKAQYLGEDKKILSLRDIFQYHNDKMGTKLCAKRLLRRQTLH